MIGIESILAELIFPLALGFFLLLFLRLELAPGSAPEAAECLQQE
jgi:multisubunit Na+/H+ antiporter MnhB subunit